MTESQDPVRLNALYLKRHVRTQNNIYWLADRTRLTQNVPLHYIEDGVRCAVTETIIGTSFFLSITNSETYSGQILTPLAENLNDEEKEYGFLQKIVQPSTQPIIQVSKFMATVRLCSTPGSIVNKHMLVGKSDSCCMCQPVCVNL